MRRALLLIVMTVLATILVVPAPAFGCSCLAPEISHTAQEADVIFIGEQVAHIDRGDRLVLSMEVHEVFKGDLGPSVSLHTWESSAACGINFAAAGTVGVAAWNDGDALSVNLCGSHWDAEVLRDFYGEPGAAPAGGLPTPEPPAIDSSGIGPVAAVVGAAAVLTVLMILRYREVQSGSN